MNQEVLEIVNSRIPAPGQLVDAEFYNCDDNFTVEATYVVDSSVYLEMLELNGDDQKQMLDLGDYHFGPGQRYQQSSVVTRDGFVYVWLREGLDI